MKNDIVAKLAHELAKEVTSEPQAVYLLVELRKLIELNKDETQYASLKFHCDWVAHPVLQGTAAQNIVRLFDQYQGLIDEHALDAEKPVPDMSFMGQLGPTLTLTNFRNELNAYLRLQGLDPSLANDNKKWATFLTYYARVVEDCPLRCVSQGLKHTDEVGLRVIDVAPEAADGQFRLTIEWSWASKVTGAANANQQAY